LIKKTPVSSPITGEERRRIEMRRISRCFTWFPNWFVYENTIYNINRFVLQESGDRVVIV